MNASDLQSISLGNKQRQFTRMLVDLLKKIHAEGYECTLGDAFRDPRVFGAMGESKGYSRANSAHKQRLAIDLNLFKDGDFKPATADHKQFGEYWESLGGTWGGRFSSPDGNHYSIRHNGIS